jgi:predicted secreted protein
MPGTAATKLRGLDGFFYFSIGNAAALAAPGTVTPTPSSSGGTLAAGTYFYKVTATNAAGETIGSPEATTTTTGSTGSVALAWSAVSGATGYKIYRGASAGAESVFFTSATNSFTDVGGAGTAGTVPTTNTSAAPLATAKMAHCSGWDIDVKADDIDASDHDSVGWKDSLDGLREWTGTIDAMYFTNDATQLALIDAALAGGIDINGDFRPLDASTEVKYTGKFRILDFKTAAKGSTAQAVNLSFKGRGPLTRAAIA